MMRSLLGLAALLGAASATGGPGTPGANQTIEYLLGLTASSRPAWITAMDKDVPGGPGGAVFDCSWRKLAYAYAPEIQTITAGKAKELFDALELAQMCGETFDAGAVRPLSAAPMAVGTKGASVIFVSPTGSDGNKGGQKDPVETLHGALARARKLACRAKAPKCPVDILMQAGTYHIDAGSKNKLADTYLELTPEDSGLTIQANEGAEVILSGGILLADLGALRLKAARPLPAFFRHCFLVSIQLYVMNLRCDQNGRW